MHCILVYNIILAYNISVPAHRAKPEDFASLRRLLVYHHVCDGLERTPGGRLHYPSASAQRIPAAPERQRKPHHEELQTTNPGRTAQDNSESVSRAFKTLTVCMAVVRHIIMLIVGFSD